MKLVEALTNPTLPLRLFSPLTHILVSKFEIIKRKEELNKQVNSTFILTFHLTLHRKRKGKKKENFRLLSNKLSLFFHCAILSLKFIVWIFCFCFSSKLCHLKFTFVSTSSDRIFIETKGFIFLMHIKLLVLSETLQITQNSQDKDFIKLSCAMLQASGKVPVKKKYF